MGRLLAISEDTTAFPWMRRTPGYGLLAMPAMVVALLVGWWTGHPAAGAIAAGSAFTVGFAVFHEALASTVLSMSVLTLGIASGTLAGSLGAPWTPLVLFIAFVVAVNYGLLASLGPTEGWIGQQSGVFVVVASYFVNGPRYALGRTMMVLAGGALQILVFTIFYLLRRKSREPSSRLSHEEVPRRLHELLACLREELTLRGKTAPYVARLSLALLISTAIYRCFHVRNGYWIPMTALLVLKPQWTGTLSRGIARMLGTVAGAGIALALAHLLPFSEWVIAALVIVSAWGCFVLQAVNYALFSVFVTLYIVFLFRFGGFSQTAAAHIRLVNTVVGGAIALAIDAAWMAATRRRGVESRAESVQ
ncbi:MAG TPA: FUSC family protein [Candidatus Aquilonibacter sp.]|nr:FUSC family protein [Candidatus Aquilonibacter sp.]